MRIYTLDVGEIKGTGGGGKPKGLAEVFINEKIKRESFSSSSTDLG